MIRVLVALCFSFGSWSAASLSPSRQFIQRFSSPRLEIPAPAPQDDGSSSDPGWLRWFFQTVLGEEPDSSPKDYQKGCAPDDFEGALRRAASAPRQATIIEQHLRRCLTDVETGARGRLSNSLGLLRLRMNLREHPFIEKVRIHLPGGGTLNGLLALKGDRKPRPFVVLRLGIFSNVDKFFAEQFALMEMFEQGPANMLVLDSSTGAQFIASNAGFNFADGVEALQNLQIAKMLRDKGEPLSALVGSLHFVGISLGSQGLFAAAAFDGRQRGGPFIDSFTALCPLIHPKETFERATAHGYRNVLGDFWARLRLDALRDRGPGLAERPWGDWLRGEPTFLRRVLALSEASGGTRASLAEGLSIPPEWIRENRVAADPWPWFRASRAPFLILATKEDGLVPPDLNALKFEQEVKGQNLNAAVVILNEGYHCTLPIAYDWNTMSAMMNGVQLATDRSWHSSLSTLEMDLGDVVPVDAVRASTKLSYKIEWPAVGSFVALRVKIAAPNGPAEFSMNLPADGFDFHLRGGALNEPGRRMIERWLHRFLRLGLMAKDGRAFLTVTWPQAL